MWGAKASPIHYKALCKLYLSVRRRKTFSGQIVSTATMGRQLVYTTKAASLI